MRQGHGVDSNFGMETCDVSTSTVAEARVETWVRHERWEQEVDMAEKDEVIGGDVVCGGGTTMEGWTYEEDKSSSILSMGQGYQIRFNSGKEAVI